MRSEIYRNPRTQRAKSKPSELSDSKCIVPCSVHRDPLADFLDVQALLASVLDDAILDVSLALPPVPAELHVLRFRLACSGHLFQRLPFTGGHLGGRRTANKHRSDNAGD